MLINKSNLELVSQDFMNNLHFEEIDIINSIYNDILLHEENSNRENELLSSLDKWLVHTKEHFAIEEEHMRAYNFFAFNCHKTEHDRALNELQLQIEHFKKNKDIKYLKKYFEEVVFDWLPNHVSTMDVVTANFISQYK
jgi:hemerythrin